jgi:hypothetical protein
MELEKASRSDLRPLYAIGFFLLWAVAYNVLGLFTWHYGWLTFLMLLTLAGLVAFAKRTGVSLASKSVLPSKTLVTSICVAAVILTGWFVTTQVQTFWDSLGHDYNQMDISENTYLASNFVFVLNTNPYTHMANVHADLQDAPHVSEENGQLWMFGVPYYFGYPYFPAMFISYEPFRRIDSSRQNIRDGNAFYYLLLLIEIGWLSTLLVPRGFKALACVLGIAAFASSFVLGEELFSFCVTDIVIPVFALAGFIAICYGRHSLGGGLFGWALACKVIPGGFFVLLLAIWYWRKRERWRFLIPMLATFLVVIVPFAWPNPGGFFSSTILFYLTSRASGDDTSMYFFVPSSLQLGFQILGFAGVVALIVWTARRRTLGLPGVIAMCFISDVVFTAFNRMCHLNYLWGVAPLGAVALVVSALGGLGSGPNQPNSELAPTYRTTVAPVAG